MQNEIRENTQTISPTTLLGDARQEVHQLTGDLARVKEIVDQAWAEAKRTRIDVEQYQAGLQSQKRRTRALWVVAILLAVVVTGVSWYSFPVMKGHSALLARVTGMHDLLGSVSNRLNFAEERLTAWTGDRDKLTDHMDKLEKRVSANLHTARNQARQMAAQIEQGLRTELSQGIEAVQARLTKVESGREADRAHLAQMREELVTVRQEIASVRQGAEQQIAKTRQDSLQDVSELDKKLVAQKGDLESLAHRLDRKRLDFELPVKRPRELSPGITLTVSRTNVSHQRLDGWLHLVSDGRILWVRGQSIQQPVVFYTQGENRAYELVFTRVKDKYVAGYLLVPKDSMKNLSVPTDEGSGTSAP